MLPGKCDRSEIPAISMARLVRDRETTNAAAPSFGEHSIHRLRGSQIILDARTCSAVTALRNMALGLATPLERFFTTTAAR